MAHFSRHAELIEQHGKLKTTASAFKAGSEIKELPIQKLFMKHDLKHHRAWSNFRLNLRF